MGCCTLQYFSVVGEAYVVSVGAPEKGPPGGVSSRVLEIQKEPYGSHLS